MAEIIKVFKEHMPELKLIGKRYGDKAPTPRNGRSGFRGVILTTLSSAVE